MEITCVIKIFQISKRKLILDDQCTTKRSQSLFLACTDPLSKIPTAERADRAKPRNVLEFHQNYVVMNGITRSNRLKQANSQSAN